MVNTCSIAATAGLPQRALYCASKGAVLALTLAMAADHVAEGIRVNCVNPGTADTPGSDGCWSGRRPGRRARRAGGPAAARPAGHRDGGRAGDRLPREPAAGSTTGTALAVDGGMQDLRLRPRPTH